MRSLRFLSTKIGKRKFSHLFKNLTIFFLRCGTAILELNQEKKMRNNYIIALPMIENVIKCTKILFRFLPIKTKQEKEVNTGF